MPASPLVASSDLVAFTVLIDGQPLAETIQIARLRVQREINRIPSAQIVLLDGSSAQETFELSESDSFVPGKEVEIKAGYHSEQTTIFKGVVVKHSISIRSDASLLLVTCFDKALKLTIGRNSTLFVKQKDSDIISKLLQDASLGASIDATDVTHEELTQFYVTDWDFIVSR